MEQDLARLRDVKGAEGFVALWRKIIADTLTEDYWRIGLPNELAVSSARSPSLFAYYAALNLLDARVLFSKMRVADLLDPAVHAKKSALERHHLFPRKYLAKTGVTDSQQTNQIANFALVEWQDNIEISDMAPAAYLPKYLARFGPQSSSGAAPEDLSWMYYWHALAPGWEKMGYQEFLQERGKRIACVVRDAFTKLFTGKAVPAQLEEVTVPAYEPAKPEPPVTSGHGLAPRHYMRRAFWEGLLKRAAGRTELHHDSSATTQNWLSASAGRAGLWYEYVIRMDGAQVQLTLYRSTREQNRDFRPASGTPRRNRGPVWRAIELGPGTGRPARVFHPLRSAGCRPSKPGSVAGHTGQDDRCHGPAGKGMPARSGSDAEASAGGEGKPGRNAGY